VAAVTEAASDAASTDAGEFACRDATCGPSQICLYPAYGCILLVLFDAGTCPDGTVVVPVADLRALVEADPWQAFKVPPAAKRVVSFLRETPATLPRFPVEKEGATIFAFDDRIVFSAYLPHPKGPVFLTLIQKTFGENVTTRTWDTVKRLAG
jgi:hypothetical protein